MYDSIKANISEQCIGIFWHHKTKILYICKITIDNKYNNTGIYYLFSINIIVVLASECKSVQGVLKWIVESIQLQL